MAVTQQSHTVFFPILDGTNHALNRVTLDGTMIQCESCHPSTQSSFAQFQCTTCHEHQPQDIMDRLHTTCSQGVGCVNGSVAMYTYAVDSCYTCHKDGTRVKFDHGITATSTGITAGCIDCHDQGKLFQPDGTNPATGMPFVPPEQFAGHPPVADCGGCHNRDTWNDAGFAPSNSYDMNQDVMVNAQLPTYSGTSIASLTPQAETLHMYMNHQSGQIPNGAMSDCGNCHMDAPSGQYYPGVFHASLAGLGLPQPTACSDCHLATAMDVRSATMPQGFVGPSPAGANIVRSPVSGEMKHDAVGWSMGAPGATKLVTDDCSVCHVAPTDPVITWATSATYHAALTAAGKPQPTQCVDCHANTRPTSPLSSPAYALPVNLSFDHQAALALGECSTCHSKTSVDWSGGKFHATNPSPGTCVACHEGERPTSNVGWTGMTPPFDYGLSNSTLGITHGDGLDCAGCHTSTTSWVGGTFPHGAATVANTTCVACHSTQRPTVLVGNNFDHTHNGQGDCFACHQATVMRGVYMTMGDWDGGQGYPGDILTSSTDQFYNVTELKLNRSGANNLVTSMSSVKTTLYNGMKHTSTQVPAAIFPGPANMPDNTTCWHCHTHDSTMTVTEFANGEFHGALEDGGFAQPTSGCIDCHSGMLPAGIVEWSGVDGGSDLQPMDHSLVGMGDCATCHHNPGKSWNDGLFHKNFSLMANQDCTVCHYPLMADGAKADKTNGTAPNNSTMVHKSAQLTFQSCDKCHGAAPANPTVASSAFSGGQLHAKVAAQPSQCNECHLVSEPAAGASTQSTVSYAVPGGSSGNMLQWNNHGSSAVAGKDCSVCHLSDAKASGAAWSKSTTLHLASVTANTCNECHGLTNGKGSVVGTNNNMPSAATNTTNVTTADSTTGVAGTFDQINHADINVTKNECKLCHTQVGVGTGSIAGKEWAQAKFHVSVGTGLISDGVTGRCSNCHWNQKPTAMFTGFDHSMVTQTGQDCGACHIFPGQGGTVSAPNWLGAAGAPATVTLNPWTSGTSLTSHTVTFAHPPASSYTSCSQCHAGSTYTTVIDYNHAGLTSNVTIDNVPVTINLGTSLYNASTNPTFCVHCHNSSSPYVTNGGGLPIVVNLTNGSSTVTTSSTAALTTGMTLTGSGLQLTTVTTTNFTGSTTAGSVTVTTASPVSLSSGTVITGPGIPANDSVAQSVNNATSFNLRTAATASGSGVALVGTRTTNNTIRIQAISNATTFTISPLPANATLTGTTLTATHARCSQANIGQHNGSVSGEDCTSCHANGGTQGINPPTPGVFGSGQL
jgi:hypothetical protein